VNRNVDTFVVILTLEHMILLYWSTSYCSKLFAFLYYVETVTMFGEGKLVNGSL